MVIVHGRKNVSRNIVDLSPKYFQVEFINFDNTTVENSVVILLRNISATDFLSHVYAGFVETIKNALNRDETLFLYNLYEGEQGLELAVALKSGPSYKSKFYTKEKLQKKREALVGVLQSDDITIGFSVCGNDKCENGNLVHLD